MQQCTCRECVRPPLKHPKDIRVLELHAGSFEDELHCILHVCSLGFDLPPAPEEGAYRHERCAFAISRENQALLWTYPTFEELRFLINLSHAMGFRKP